MADESSPTVYLLRSASEPDPYVAAFREVGLQAQCVPVLRFTFSRQDALRSRLQHPEQYGGLVLTSPRAVAALADAMSGSVERRAAWAEKPTYVVGPKTASGVRGLGLEPVGEESGGAEALISVIEKKKKPLLFLCSNRRRDAIPEGLGSASIPFEELQVYETRPREDIHIPAESGSDWLVFFSPSGVEAVRRSSQIETDSFHKAAIGPTTASALEREGWTAEAVAEEPTPDALVSAIVDAIRTHERE